MSGGLISGLNNAEERPYEGWKTNDFTQRLRVVLRRTMMCVYLRLKTPSLMWKIQPTLRNVFQMETEILWYKLHTIPSRGCPVTRQIVGVAGILRGRKRGRKGEGIGDGEGKLRGGEREITCYKNPFLLISVVIMNSVVIMEIMNNLSRYITARNYGTICTR